MKQRETPSSELNSARPGPASILPLTSGRSKDSVLSDAERPPLDVACAPLGRRHPHLHDAFIYMHGAFGGVALAHALGFI